MHRLCLRLCHCRTCARTITTTPHRTARPRRHLPSGPTPAAYSHPHSLSLSTSPCKRGAHSAGASPARRGARADAANRRARGGHTTAAAAAQTELEAWVGELGGEEADVALERLSMGRLLSQLEAEAEAVQGVALSALDERGYVAKYLQVIW